MKQLMFAYVFAVSVMVLADDFTVVTNGTEVTVTPLVSAGTTFSDTFLDPFVSKAIFSAGNKQFTYAPSGIPTYAGGTEIQSGQIHISGGDIFGSGDISLGVAGDPTKAALIANGKDITVTNKVVFNNSNSYAMGYNAGGSITLKSIGTAASGLRTVRFGRENSGAESKVVLSLTDPASEALNRIYLQGACELKLDGGTVKALTSANNPFFHVSTAGDVADISVTTNGVTFDVPADGNLHIGQQLKFPVLFMTNVLETCRPANHGFEDGKTANWTFTKLEGGEGDSDVKTTPNAWDGSGIYPPVDSKFAMVRQGVRLSTTVAVPTDGLWRVAFYRGGRPSYSSDISLDVALDESITHYPASSELAFTQYRTSPVDLNAGSHTISFTTSNGGSGHSLNIDEVSLERIEIASVRGTLAKSGTGRMLLSGQDLTGVPVVVDTGTLSFYDVTIDGGAVAIESGARAEMEDMTIGGLVDVASGGTNVLRNSMLAENGSIAVTDGGVLALTDFGTNLVANGSFEQNGPQTYTQNKPTGWTWAREEDLGSINEDGGMQGNGGTLSAIGPYTPADSVTIYLREACSFKQQINCTAAGKYRISLLAADRKLGHSEQIPIYVKIGDDIVLTIPARDSYADYTRYFVDVDLAASNYELKILTGKAATPAIGNIVFVDDVRVRKIIQPLGTMENGELRLAAGAELNLDLIDSLDVKKVFVNDVQIRGGNATLRNAGVIVTGSGKIHAGARRGIAIGFR